MLRALTEEEIKLNADRLRDLYTSPWTVDNITAVLMDSSLGGTGLNEADARQKAHRVIGWIETIAKVVVPERR